MIVIVSALCLPVSTTSVYKLVGRPISDRLLGVFQSVSILLTTLDDTLDDTRPTVLYLFSFPSSIITFPSPVIVPILPTGGEGGREEEGIKEGGRGEREEEEEGVGRG